MTYCRSLILVCGCAALLAAVAAPAYARSSRNRSNRRGNSRTGRYRIIEDDRDDRDDRRKKQLEEKKKKEEEARKRAEERKKKQEDKKKAAQAKKKEAQDRKKAQQQKTARKAAPARKTARKPATGGPAKKNGEQADAEAAKLYEQAEKLFEEGELLPGAKLLRQCIADYEGSEPAKDAQARLDQLLALEPYGPMILHAEADELFGAQRYRRALNKYHELLASFPNSEQAAEARTRLAEIRDGDLLSKTVYTEEELEDARLWFLVGNIHHENQRIDDATTAWRKVVENFPGCRYAKQAEQKLAAASPSS